MSRNDRKIRRLVVDGKDFLWSLRHANRSDGNNFLDCGEILTIYRGEPSERLLIVFQQRPDRLVADGHGPSATVYAQGGVVVNLHKPGTVRALIDEAMQDGWPTTRQIDGWPLVDAIAARVAGEGGAQLA
ncbi:hypothetical protein GCM10009765_49270 [Fodinicola feengrottensis]|uniref:Uncharacterized protein n=1 Tax=Fodinicola feengrottensis TaxID=435914 RepID=A0ABN2HVB1_9ACTN